MTLSESIGQSIDESELKGKLSSEAGAIVALVRRDSLEVFPLGTGVTADTPMEIASLTKVFMALLVADAIRRQELQLSTRIDELLFGEQWAGVPAINVEQLATHSSGLPRLSFPLWKIFLHPRDPYRCYSRADLMACLRRTKPRVPAAMEFCYSNFGYAVLGLMLEKAASQTYEQLLKERVLDPLGMRESGLQLVGQPDRASAGYRPGGCHASLWHHDAYAPAGAMVSTLNDLVSAARSFLDPSNAVSAALEMTLQPRMAVPGGSIGFAWLTPTGGDCSWHNGATFGFTSYLGIKRQGINTQEGGSIVILANQALAKEATELGHQLMRLISGKEEGSSG